MSAYSNALLSDDEDEPAPSRAPGAVRPSGTRISFAGGAKPARPDSSFLSPAGAGGSAFHTLRGGRKVSRGQGGSQSPDPGPARPISPGGRSEMPFEEEGEVEPTPLPWVPLTVLCICMVSSELSKNAD